MLRDDARREIARTLNADRRQLTEEQRREVAPVLRAEGHSLRAIGGALGVSRTQVERDLAGVTYVTPARTAGLDGKSYPAQRPMVLVVGQLLSDCAEDALNAAAQKHEGGHRRDGDEGEDQGIFNEALARAVADDLHVAPYAAVTLME